MKVRISDQELARFEYLVVNMTPRSKVYKMLKRVLSEQGYWKNKPRNRPSGLPSQLQRYELDHKLLLRKLRSP